VNTPITLTNSTEIGLTTVPYNKGGTGLTSYTEGDYYMLLLIMY